MISLKQGTTLNFDMIFIGDDEIPIDISGLSFFSAICPRNNLSQVMASLIESTRFNHDGRVIFQSVDTSSWPIGDYFMDIRMLSGSNVTFSETILIEILDAIT